MKTLAMPHDAVRHVRRFAAIIVAGALLATPTFAELTVDEGGILALYGDFRLRIEHDWNSRRANGSERDDRTRARLRGRLGVKVRPTDWLELGSRARTGSRDSQTSPHITFIDFDDNDKGAAEAMFDKYYAKLTHTCFAVTLGRDSLPLWKQNELLWDDDVTALGVGVRVKLGAAFQLRGGYYTFPDGGVDFNGEGGVAQAVYQGKNDSAAWTVATGLILLEGEDERAKHLRRGNGMRDYSIWTTSLKTTFEAVGQPVALGLDVMFNFEDYDGDDVDLFTALNRDETTGYVLSARLGSTSPGKWLGGYYYAHIETFAVNASYAQDDWVRWGSATQTDSSDFEGHEFRLGYGVAKNMNLIARLYLVDAITSDQDGNRFRVDFNVKF